MSQVNIITLSLLLFVACLVAIGSRRLGLPYTIGLVIAGIALSLAGYRSGIALTPELIFTFLLPPLVFEAALHLTWRRFRERAPLVLCLSFVGTLVAATDPVAVIAMMKEQRADPNLRFVMEAESLLNDCAAAVLFALCAGAIAGASTDAATVVQSFAVIVVGGVASGLIVAGGLLIVAGRSDDHLVELTLPRWQRTAHFCLPRNLAFLVFWRPWLRVCSWET